MNKYKLRRWYVNDNETTPFIDKEGDWVKWDDVEPLLKAYLELNHNFNEIKRVLSKTMLVY